MIRRISWVQALVMTVIGLHAVWPLLWGGQVLIPLLDFADAGHPYFTRLAHDPNLGAGPEASFAPLLGGSVWRGVMPSEWSLVVLLYRLLPDLAALQLHHLVVVTSAFVSMVVLLRKLFPQREAADIHWAVAGIFALVRFYPPFSIGIATMPLLAAALVTIEQTGRPTRANLWAWLTCVLYPLGTVFIFTTAFVIGLGALYGFARIAISRRVQWPWFGALALLALVSFLVEWRLIALLIGPGLGETHRIEFQLTYSQLNFHGFFITALRHLFWFESNSYELLYTGWLGIAAILGLIIAAWQMPTHRRLAVLGLGVWGIAFVCAAAELALSWGLIRPLLDWYYSFPLFRAVDLSRLYTLVPVVMPVFLAIALHVLGLRWPRALRWGATGAFFYILLTTLWMLPSNVEYYSQRLFSAPAPPTTLLVGGEVPYRAFYAKRIFAQVEQHIGRPQGDYRVACLGFHPGMAGLSGFYTVDGYSNAYPLAYKRAFRQVIAGELARDSALARYYDHWGSRAYLFSAELWPLGVKRFLATPSVATHVEQLAIDTRALHALGCDYIFSAVVIGNADALGLTLEGIFKHSDTPWQLRLYRVSPPPIPPVGG